MSTISTILSTLRSAVWAIDVRDEIANAIEQCYKDVNSPSLVTDGIEEVIGDMVDNGRISGAIVEDLGLITEGTSNLFDFTTVTAGRLNTSTGEVGEASGYWTSDFIPVENGKTYYFANTDRRVAYNSSKAYSANISGTTWTASADGYIRVSVTSANRKTAKINEGSAKDYRPGRSPIDFNLRDDVYRKAEVDAALAAVTIATDPELETAGAAADAKATGDAISALNESLGEVKSGDRVAISWTLDGYINTSGATVNVSAVTSSENFRYSITPAREGDIFFLNVTGGNSPRAWCFVDASYNVLSVSGASVTCSDTKVIAPQNAAYAIIQDNTRTKDSYKSCVLTEKVKAVVESIENIDTLELKPDPNMYFTRYKKVEADGSSTNDSTGGSTEWRHDFADVDAITVDGTNVTKVELVGYDAENAYVGVWDASEEEWVRVSKFTTEIDIASVRALYPTYTYRLNIKRLSTVSETDIQNYVFLKWGKTKYIDEQIGKLYNIVKFDNDSVDIVDNTSIEGATGIEKSDSSCVSTNFVDVSRRISNDIVFYSTIVANPTGFAIYDSGKKRIAGAWGNMPNLSDYGLYSSNIPQRIKWTLPENAYYIRATMTKNRYTKPSDFGFDFYQIPKIAMEGVSYKGNFMTIAHKGYGVSNGANSLKSFIQAAEAGFRAVEIDCRKTADGVWVCSHNESGTLYRNGSGTSYTIANVTWDTIKDTTVDANGDYPITKVSTVLNTLRKYDIIFVLDRKVDTTNSELLKLARRCGVENQVMISYYDYESFVADLPVLKNYPTVSIRFNPILTKTQFDGIRSEIPNPLYADINYYDYRETSKKYGTSNALAYPVPILAAGASKTETVRMFAAIASGAMSNQTLQYSPKDFIDMISLDYTQNPTLTASSDSVSVGVNAEVSLTALSSIDDPACYPYAYSDDLAIFKVGMSAPFSANPTIYVAGISAGTADLVIFSATGEEIRIPVTVS